MTEREPDEKQTTDKGLEIPVPERSEWEAFLDKATTPKPSSDDEGSDG
jgi:hypothetical protein